MSAFAHEDKEGKNPPRASSSRADSAPVMGMARLATLGRVKVRMKNCNSNRIFRPPMVHLNQKHNKMHFYRVSNLLCGAQNAYMAHDAKCSGFHSGARLHRTDAIRTTLAYFLLT